jgi:hypothetical protein
LTATACLKKRRRPKLRVDGSLFRRPASFEPLRGQRRDRYVTLCAFACSKGAARSPGPGSETLPDGRRVTIERLLVDGKFCTGALRSAASSASELSRPTCRLLLEALIRNKSVAPSHEGMGRPNRAPHYLLNCCLRTSRLIFSEIGREPARKLDMLLEKARKVIKIAKAPLCLETHRSGMRRTATSATSSRQCPPVELDQHLAGGAWRSPTMRSRRPPCRHRCRAAARCPRPLPSRSRPPRRLRGSANRTWCRAGCPP